MLPLDRYDAVFNVSINRVGILTDRQVAAVFKAYLPLRALTWRLRVLAAVDVGQNAAGAEEHVFLSGKALEVASQMHCELIPDIETAIAELEAKAKNRILKI